MAIGVVKAWIEDKGFGFLTEDDGPDVFVHAKSLPDGLKQLDPGVRVQFEKKQTPRGVQALDVKLVTDWEDDVTLEVLTEAEFLTELRVILPPLREVHKQALLDNARGHGWVD